MANSHTRTCARTTHTTTHTNTLYIYYYSVLSKGNDNIHLLTASRGNKLLKIYMQFNGTGLEFELHYNQFEIDNEENLFRISDVSCAFKLPGAFNIILQCLFLFIFTEKINLKHIFYTWKNHFRYCIHRGVCFIKFNPRLFGNRRGVKR